MPGSSYSSLMHELIALAYHAATVRRLYVGSSALSAASKSLQRISTTSSGRTKRHMVRRSVTGGEGLKVELPPEICGVTPAKAATPTKAAAPDSNA
jgi:hypothetical protein